MNFDSKGNEENIYNLRHSRSQKLAQLKENLASEVQKYILRTVSYG